MTVSNISLKHIKPLTSDVGRSYENTTKDIPLEYSKHPVSNAFVDDDVFELVIVSCSEDFTKIIHNKRHIIENLKPEKIVVICPKNCIGNDNIIYENVQIIFMDEDSVFPGLTINSIKSIMTDISGDDKRSGWYFQQFLKMAYAFISNTQNYLIWDADTIPLNKLSFKRDNDKLVFTMKTEYHKPYFDTIDSLLGYQKRIDRSFIAEHMMIDSDIMKHLIWMIDGNAKLQGNSFFEKIMRCIKISDLKGSGFSEFETYGTFVLENYPDRYEMQSLRTGRHAKRIVGNFPSDEHLLWASKSYDTISIEKLDRVFLIVTRITKHTWYQRLIKMSWTYNLIKCICAFEYLFKS